MRWVLLSCLIASPVFADTLVLAKAQAWHGPDQVAKWAILKNPTENAGFLEDKSIGFRVAKNLVITTMELPSKEPLQNMTTSEDYEIIKSRGEDLLAFAKANPKFAKALAPYVENYETRIVPGLARFKQGYTLEGGVWVSPEDRQEAEKQRLAREAAAKERVAQQKRAEEDARKADAAARQDKLDQIAKDANAALENYQKAKAVAEKEWAEKVAKNREELSQLSSEDRKKEQEVEAAIVKDLRHLNSVTSLGLSYSDYNKVILELKPRLEENLRNVKNVEFGASAADLLYRYSMALLIWRETINSGHPSGLLRIDAKDQSTLMGYGIKVDVVDANYVIDGNQSVSTLFTSSGEKLTALEAIKLPDDKRALWKKVLQ